MRPLFVVDVETTGMDPERDRVVEIGVVAIDTRRRKIEGTWTSLVNPGVPMPPAARAVHHISDADVARAPSIEQAMTDLLSWAGTNERVLLAHNAAFDSAFLPQVEGEWVCSWRCAQTAWPALDSYSNHAVRYAVPEIEAAVRRSGLRKTQPAHRALPDAWVTAHVALALLDEMSVEELLEVTAAPILLRTVRFGKHRGEAWADVPRDYLQWILRKDAEFDRDVVHTARHYLG